MKNNCLFGRYDPMKKVTAGMIMLATPILSSCGSDERDYSFKKPDDAIHCYQSFYSQVKEIKDVNVTGFSDVLNQWYEINDTVKKFLMKDSLLLKDLSLCLKYTQTQDSIRTKLIHISETWDYGYKEVMQIKLATTPYRNDGELKEAVKKYEPYFDSLDDEVIPELSIKEVLLRYKIFLLETKKKGISDEKALLAYIKQEDYCFRLFLSHMYELGAESVDEITRLTDQISKDVFVTVSKGEIKATDAVAIMSMRTVRRLLLNSIRCLEYFEQKKIEDSSIMNTYLWMALQPILSTDKVILGTITGKQKKQFDKVVSMMRDSKNFADGFGSDLALLNKELPQRILKLYLLSF